MGDTLNEQDLAGPTDVEKEAMVVERFVTQTHLAYVTLGERLGHIKKDCVVRLAFNFNSRDFPYGEWIHASCLKLVMAKVQLDTKGFVDEKMVVAKIAKGFSSNAPIDLP
ncbi:hypothetical protein Ancab_019725 [Ancistrocladus abbreviatus]